MADPRAPARGRRGARARLGGGRRAARPRSGSCAGGLRPEEVARRRQRTGARVVHAHNVNPTFGAAGAGGRARRRARASSCTCTTTGWCARSAPASRRARTARAATAATRSRASSSTAAAARGPSRPPTPPGSRCISGGSSRAADAIVVPSAFALQRLRDARRAARRQRARPRLRPAHVRRRARPPPPASSCSPPGRLTPEKGFADVVDACARGRAAAGVAGDGPQRAELEARAAAGDALHRPDPRGRARGAARAGRGRRRPEPLRRDPAARRAGGDGRRPADRRGALGRARRGGARRRACTRRATSTRSPQRLTALYGDAPAGERALAAARARSAPEVIAAQLASDLRRRPKLHGRD